MNCRTFIAAVAIAIVLPFAVHAQDLKKITIGVVAKSQSNAVFQAAYQGAKDAAKELGPQYGADVTIDWQTPADEDAQKPATVPPASQSPAAKPAPCNRPSTRPSSAASPSCASIPILPRANASRITALTIPPAARA
jgi:hypothetical protein